MRMRHDEEGMLVMVMEQELHQVQACPENPLEFLDLCSKTDLLRALKAEPIEKVAEGVV